LFQAKDIAQQINTVTKTRDASTLSRTSKPKKLHGAAVLLANSMRNLPLPIN
jgi:hypothetical protein